MESGVITKEQMICSGFYEIKSSKFKPSAKEKRSRFREDSWKSNKTNVKIKNQVYSSFKYNKESQIHQAIEIHKAPKSIKIFKDDCLDELFENIEEEVNSQNVKMFDSHESVLFITRFSNIKGNVKNEHV